MIDQTAINLIDLIPTPLKKVASTNGGEYAGACPMCGGNDRFRVQPNARPNPRWFCRQCTPRGGDAIQFLVIYSNLSFKEACKELRIHLDTDTFQKSAMVSPVTDYLPYSREKPTGSDSEQWQDRAHKFIDYAENMLWHSDKTMLGYLHERGFSDETIMRYRLGYNPTTVWDDWGMDKNVWLPAGLVIPYEIGEYSTITKIRIRRLDYKPDDEIGKYIPPAGGKNTAFLTRPLLLGDYVVLCEGELDAMIFKQHVHNPYFVGMATGGTHGAKLLKYLALLSLAKRVFVAFDSDKSGEKASKYWLDALPNAVRLEPTRMDINDMVMAGFKLHDWIRKGINRDTATKR